MIRSFKIRLKPTKEQEELMIKSCDVARWAYNYSLARKNETYELNGISIMESVIKKEITSMKKTDEYRWINDVSAQITTMSVKACELAFKKFFSKKGGYPKFKKKNKAKPCFYVRPDMMYFKNGTIRMEKIGFVKFSSNYRFEDGRLYYKFSNPRCFYDGKYWYIGFGLERNKKQVCLKPDLKIGIDLGIKELAVCSNGLRFKNINKTYKMKQLEKKLKRFQRQCSRKYEMNKQGNKFVKTKNIIKLEKKIKLIYRRMKNIRMNHIHQTTRRIINEKPCKIIIEDLRVTNMNKNKHLSKQISEQYFYEFRRQIEYKSEEYGICLVIADRWFPSSKMCSSCGNINNKLKLSDRIYKCEHCGLEIDRDLNASINLSKLD